MSTERESQREKGLLLKSCQRVYQKVYSTVRGLVRVYVSSDTKPNWEFFSVLTRKDLHTSLKVYKDRVKSLKKVTFTLNNHRYQPKRKNLFWPKSFGGFTVY